MQTIKEFLKPDWRKALVFAVFALIAVGGHIQAWAFSDVPPKPPLYDLLRPFPIWPIWAGLLMPLIMLSLPLRIIGLDIMSGSFWLFAAANVLYFYFLSCLLVVSFDRYKSRFPRWLWAATTIAPLALHLPGLIVDILLDQPPLPVTLGERIRIMLFFPPTSPVGSLYLYLLSCLGFFVYDVFKKRSRGKMSSKEDLMSLLLTLVIVLGLIVGCTPRVTPAATLVPPTATPVQPIPTVLASTATPEGDSPLDQGVIKEVLTTLPEIPEDWVLVYEKTYAYRDEEGHLVTVREAEYREPPTVGEIIAYGEELSFEICGESTTWVRPAEQEQNAKWWSSGRYAGGNEEVIKYPWTHNFFVAYGHASGEYDITNLSGLWTLPGDVRAKCFEPERHDAILKLQTAEVWVLLHRVKTIKRVGIYYVIVVEPTEKGVQFVQFPRPECHLPLTLYFVTEDGQEIEKIVEAESRYWPYPQLILTPTPAPMPPPTLTATRTPTSIPSGQVHPTATPMGIGTVIGQVVLGYGERRPVSGLPFWIGPTSEGRPIAARTDADGRFRIEGVPVGTQTIVDSHLEFEVTMPEPGATVDVGTLKYPLIHPPAWWWQVPATPASPAEIIAHGEELPFILCQADATWQRPSEAEQMMKVWAHRPFADRSSDWLRWWFTRPAIRYLGADLFVQDFPGGPDLTAPGADRRALLGLWTAGDVPNRCGYDGARLERLLNGQKVELWLLGYASRSVYCLSNQVVVVVEATAAGYQIIEFAGLRDTALTIHVMDDAGHEIARLPLETGSK